MMRGGNSYSSSSWSGGGAGRRGHRRLPATPTQPSTLNIDSLANISHSISSTGNNTGPGAVNDSGATLNAPINFPKLNTSPSRYTSFDSSICNLSLRNLKILWGLLSVRISKLRRLQLVRIFVREGILTYFIITF